ncbi:MAG: ABC transporter permease [Rhodospirillales bacterium]|nr:ABC transporter permease [Rhodospirillales bacterium]
MSNARTAADALADDGLAPGTHVPKHPIRRIFRSPIALVGLLLIFSWIAAAVFAPLIAPYTPNSQHVTAIGTVPSVHHWLGADALKRDILSRILWGARPVLTLAPLALAAAYLVGVTLGLIAGYAGGWVDDAISRTVDVLLSFPKIVIYVVLIATVGPSKANIVVAVILVAAPGIARLTRGLTLEVKTNDYVAAAATRGEHPLYIMFAEILPNVRGPLIVDACMRMGYTIIAIGVLGFLGLGLPPPDPDWGGMVREGAPMLIAFPHMALFPCFAIISLVLGFNLLADGLQESRLRA